MGTVPTRPPTDRQIAALTRAVGREELTVAQLLLLVELLDALGSALKVTSATLDGPTLLGALETTRERYGELVDAVSPS